MFPGAAHQRDQVIAKTAEQQGSEQVNHHDHAVHGDGLVILVRRNERKGVGEAELQAHRQAQHQSNQAHRDGSQAVLYGNDFVVLAPDVLGDKCLGIMQVLLVVTVCNCNISHQYILLPRSAGYIHFNWLM